MDIRGHTDRGGEIGLTEDDVHRLLSAERRRLALEVLEERGPMGIEDLATAIVEREDPDAAGTTDATRRTMVDLYHRHLPMMDDLGAVEFDRQSRRVVSCLVTVVAK